MALGDYYIDENLDTWVKDTIPASSTITRYVQKTGAFTPDGDAVFEFFDDFSGAVLDTTKWNSQGDVSYSVGEVIMSGSAVAANAIWAKTDFLGATLPVVMKAKTKHHIDSAYSGLGFDFWGQDWRATANSGVATISGWTTADILARNVGDSTAVHDLKIGTASIWDIQWKSSQAFTFISSTESDNVTWNLPQAASPCFYARGAITTVKQSAYWVFVYKYLATLPVVTVTDMTDYFKVEIQNTTGTTMTDVQVRIPSADLSPTAQSDSFSVTSTVPPSFTVSTGSATVITDTTMTMNGTIGGL